MVENHTVCTIFQGRAGDHNDLAIPAAKSLGNALASCLGQRPTVIGTPKPALSAGWREELDAAMPDLHAVQQHFAAVFASGAVSVAATSRCAVSLATLPALAQHYPDACLVWFDAHADLNTPASSTSGFLGGLALAGPLGLWDTGLGSGIRMEQVVLVGQRDLDPFEVNLIEQHNISCLPPGEDLPDRLRKAVAGRAVYVHLDCDVLAPGTVPTDYQSEGGLTLAELTACCKVLACSSLIGIEIAELQNAWQPEGPPVSPEKLVAALMPLLQ
ncbi:arginase family enzyme [Erwinia persicina]|uniref:arginase family protein n=1 Tax=Erwinia persicina TaxID=55211 RepID=UPI0020A1B693|nr:arginase family protein [Erwinia persicina]MCP1438174.1 arginase family enzyme [Erwinia persicina]